MVAAGGGHLASLVEGAFDADEAAPFQAASGGEVHEVEVAGADARECAFHGGGEFLVHASSMPGTSAQKMNLT